MNQASPFKRSLVGMVACCIGMLSCTTEQKFPSVGDAFTGPIDVVSHNNLFYVLNSDFDRRYNSGSIVVVDPATGSKTRSHEVDRMGRSMHVVDNSMLVTYDRVELEAKGRVELMSLDGTGGLQVTYSQELDCSPINGIISPLRTYAVVSCLGGELFVASLNGEFLPKESFKKVRDYDYSRRALYIYEENDQAVLFAFPTDMGDQTAIDLVAADILTTTNVDLDNSEVTTAPGANGIPDVFEDTVDDYFSLNQRAIYQAVVYNLKKEEELGFPEKKLGSLLPSSESSLPAQDNAYNDLVFIHYTLENPLSDPIPGGVVVDDDAVLNNYYRANFWEAKAGSTPQEFYLSQRGLNGLGDSNNILKVTIGNREDDTDIFNGPYGDTYESLPTSSSMFDFERVSGASYLEKQGYPGDFEIVDFNNETFLFVNQFRDEAYWDAGTRLYAIDAKPIRSEGNLEEVPFRWEGADYTQSAYQLASTANYLAACSFYGDSLIIFSLDSSKGIDDEQTPTIVY